MIIRLGQDNPLPRHWDSYRDLLVKYRDCCDEVWFSTGCSFPPLDVHRYYSDLISECASWLRGHGIRASLQIQSTIGHNDNSMINADMSGKTWGSYVGKYGERCQFNNCYRQPAFLDYIRQMSQIYAQWQPDSVWVDDDLRLRNHAPAKDPGGCYCPYCLSVFSKAENKEYTREELVAACDQDPELQKRWDDYGTQGICSVVEAIVEGFSKISPDTRFGLQHCTDPSRLFVFDAFARASGKRVGSRPGGGAYVDHDPYYLVDKAFYVQKQASEQPGYELISQVCPEIENYPRAFCNKTARGLRLESMLYLSLGADSLSYYVSQTDMEPAEWYGEEIFKPLAADAKDFREYIKHNRGTIPGGVRLTGETWMIDPGLPFIGMPVAGHARTGNCLQLCQDGAEKMSVEKLTEILAQNVILNGQAAMALQKRNLSHLMGNVKVSHLPQGVNSYMTDDPINDGLFDSFHMIPGSGGRYVIEPPEGSSYRVVSSYKARASQTCFGNEIVLVELPAGNRLAFIGYDGFRTDYISAVRVRLLNRICDWLSHETLPAVTGRAVRCILIPRVTPEGKLRSVSIVNNNIDFSKPFDLLMRNGPENVSSAEWHVPSERPVEIALRRENNFTVAQIPAMTPWDIGWLKLP